MTNESPSTPSAPSAASAASAALPRLRRHYDEVLRLQLKEKFSYRNIMEVPRLEKVCLNMGVGEATTDRKNLEKAIDDLTLIAGQRPAVTRARNAVAGFKLRKGQGIGCRVTLRRARMYEFVDRLTTIALPRVKDFRGLSRKAFDGKGNYALGIHEQIVFPEINYDKIDKIRGLDIVVCTTATTNAEALALLEGFNFPFVAERS